MGALHKQHIGHCSTNFGPQHIIQTLFLLIQEKKIESPLANPKNTNKAIVAIKSAPINLANT